MRHARRQKEDPLAGIEDMLSSLCGAQSSRIDTRGSDEEVGQGDNQNVSQAEKSPSGDDEGLTTPEIIPSSKPRQRKMAGGMRRRSNGLKRNPPAQRIRKSQKGKTNRQPGVRSAFQSARLGDFVDDEKQDNDVIGTSSDEQENAIFLNQMKLLAEEHLNVSGNRTSIRAVASKS